MHRNILVLFVATLTTLFLNSSQVQKPYGLRDHRFMDFYQRNWRVLEFNREKLPSFRALLKQENTQLRTEIEALSIYLRLNNEEEPARLAIDGQQQREFIDMDKQQRLGRQKIEERQQCAATVRFLLQYGSMDCRSTPSTRRWNQKEAIGREAIGSKILYRKK